MVVVDKLINGSLYDHRTAVKRFSSGAAFSEVRKSEFCAFHNANSDNNT